MADAYVTLQSGALNAIQGDKGELAGPTFWQAVLTQTAVDTTNVFGAYLTVDGLDTGKKIFARTPALWITVLANKADPDNAAITDGRYAWPMTYDEATGLLVWAAVKMDTAPAIIALADGEFTFLIAALGY